MTQVVLFIEVLGRFPQCRVGWSTSLRRSATAFLRGVPVTSEEPHINMPAPATTFIVSPSAPCFCTMPDTTSAQSKWLSGRMQEGGCSLWCHGGCGT